MNSFNELLAQGKSSIDLTSRNDLNELSNLADELYKSKSNLSPSSQRLKVTVNIRYCNSTIPFTRVSYARESGPRPFGARK